MSAGRAAAVTAGVVIAAAVFGQALAGDDPFAALDAYRQPWFALPRWGWVAVGIVYYAIAAIVLYRMLRHGDRAAVGVVIAVVVANETWNILVFGLRAPLVAFVGMIAFALLVGVAFAVVRRHDRLAAWALGAYLLWVVVYDLPWSLALAVLNR